MKTTNKKLVLDCLLKGGVYYTWYRFDKKSNYITFNQWCLEFIENMSEIQMLSFIVNNKLEVSK